MLPGATKGTEEQEEDRLTKLGKEKRREKKKKNHDLAEKQLWEGAREEIEEGEMIK